MNKQDIIDFSNSTWLVNSYDGAEVKQRIEYDGQFYC